MHDAVCHVATRCRRAHYLAVYDPQGPGAWDEDRFRAGVPAHSDEPVLNGCDHAAPGDGADLLGLHEHPVANLDHHWPPVDDDGTRTPSVLDAAGFIQGARGWQSL